MRFGTYVAKLQGLVIGGLLLQLACGGNGSGNGNGGGSQATVPAGQVGVVLVGMPADINIGDTLPVTAQVQGSSSAAVIWTVDDIPNGNGDVGLISGTGNTVNYSAPATEGSHVVAAISVLDPTKSAAGRVGIHRQPSIASLTINPATCALNVGIQQQFAATVTGTGSYNSAITWSTQRGVITSTGLYTAPSTGGSDTVTAKSVEDTTKFAAASITVNTVNTVNPTISSVSVSPATLTLNANTQSQFAATIAGTGSYNPAVNWTAQRGTISSSGLYTAPATGGSDTVTATSVQDAAKVASANLSVTAPSAVVVAAVSPATATRTVNKAGLVFTSGVTGSSNTAITWGVNGGTITAGQGTSSMTWTAPSAASSVTITATSQADSSKSASTTVTVVPAAVASLSASSTAPLYGSTNVTITPVFSGATSAIVGTTQGGNDVSASPVSGSSLAVPAGFTPSVASTFMTSYTRSVPGIGTYSQLVTSSASTPLVSIVTGFKEAPGSVAFVRSAGSSLTGQLAGVKVVAGDLILVSALRGATLTSVTVSDNAVGGSNTYFQVGSGVAETVNFNSGYQFYAIAKNTETLMITDSLFGVAWDGGCLVHVIAGTNGVAATVLDGQSLVADTADQTSHTNPGPTTFNNADLILAVWMDGANASKITQTGVGFTSAQTYWLRATNAAGDYTDSSITVTPTNPVAPTITAVAVNPATVTLNTSTQNQFTATVTGTGTYSSAVSWSAQRGSITSTGLYTAPSTNGSDVVTATSVQDTTKTATSSVTVAVPSSSSSITAVAVGPATFSLSASAQNQFTATVTGTGTYSSAVTWSAQRGSITSTGLYTAPSTSCSDVVTAKSVQDTTKTATSSITVGASSVPAGTSVKTYGAKGDGVTDDTAAIQACINAVAGTGGTVVVPDGTYMINATHGSGVWGLMMGSNMNFAMTSGATLKAITNSSTDYGILCSNGASNFTITGGNIVGERSTHTGSGGEAGMGIYLNASNVTVSGVNVSECWGDGIYICDASSNITITNCISNHNRRQGLSITAGNTFLISGCTFSNTTGTDPQCGIDIEPNGSVPVTGVHITNCQIFGNAGGGVQQGNVGNVASGTLLENCNIYSNGGGGYNDGGIRFVETHDNIIRNNNIHNNLNGGIMLDTNAGIGCPNTTLTGNTVANNSGWGIYANLCNGSAITGNTITGNSGAGFTHDSSTGTYSPNTTSGNGS
jgi:parallel beta-helix repeat protein